MNLKQLLEKVRKIDAAAAELLEDEAKKHPSMLAEDGSVDDSTVIAWWDAQQWRPHWQRIRDLIRYPVTIAEMEERTGYHPNTQAKFRKANVLSEHDHWEGVESDLPHGRIMYREEAVDLLLIRRKGAKRGRPKINRPMGQSQ
jgi:hypothetical protein